MRNLLPAAVLTFFVASVALPACGDPSGAADGGGVSDAGATDDGGAPEDGGSADAGATDGGETPDGGAPEDGGSPGDGGEPTGCGDGRIQPPEVCDDGNSRSGDGCSAGCDRIEQSWACPTPGAACVSTVVCGDGRVSGAETCDDGDTVTGDGCSETCEVQPGWICPVAGAPCEAATCGDGIVAGAEACDDGGNPPVAGDGCDVDCRLEPGWVCPTGETCRETECGDGDREGSEPCDDGNDEVGDGCSPFCEVEPDCSAGPCTSACGDGMILATDAEECDDGNTAAGDGCDPACRVEAGYACTLTSEAPPEVLEVPVTFRDFVALPLGGSVRHPDFEIFSGSQETPGLLEPVLDPDGKPVYRGRCDAAATYPDASCPYGQQLTETGNFDQWYRSVDGVNLVEVRRLPLTRDPADGSYKYLDASLFPFDGSGWVAAGLESLSDGHDFGFTSEVRYWFEYQGGETLYFSGDDDVWVFINDRLALDLGGVHPRRDGSVTLDAGVSAGLGLEAGKVYEIALFHAERHTNASNFNLTLNGFVKQTSRCEAECGDAIVAGDERCDDGLNDGRYGGCTAGCLRAPFCGDGVVQADHEDCDDGVNLTTYGRTAPGCAPGCVTSAWCGDGNVDSLFGESCDDAVNDGAYGGCRSDCSLAPRCGDGSVDETAGEQCDDGNLITGDGCTAECEYEIIP